MPNKSGVRLQAAYYKAAESLLMFGASPYEIDEAMVEFDFVVGPYETQDLNGLDLAYKSRKAGLETTYPYLFGLIISDRMVQDGKLGKKVNAGWYRYPGGNGKVEDPIVEDLVIEESWFAKIERREFNSEEIKFFILSGIINEGCRIMDEDANVKFEQIDRIAREHLNFPTLQGSLMNCADTLGVTEIAHSLDKMKASDALFCKPAIGLSMAMAQNVSLLDFYSAR